MNQKNVQVIADQLRCEHGDHLQHTTFTEQDVDELQQYFSSRKLDFGLIWPITHEDVQMGVVRAGGRLV